MMLATLGTAMAVFWPCRWPVVLPTAGWQPQPAAAALRPMPACRPRGGPRWRARPCRFRVPPSRWRWCRTARLTRHRRRRCIGSARPRLL